MPTPGPRRSTRTPKVPAWHKDYLMETDGAEMSASEFRRHTTENLGSVGVGGMCEDDISDTSSSGGISAGGTGTTSPGAAAPHAEQRAADEARVNTVVKEALLKNGVDGHVIANILGRLAATQ